MLRKLSGVHITRRARVATNLATPDLGQAQMIFYPKNSAIEFTTHDCTLLEIPRERPVLLREGAELVIRIIKTFLLVRPERIVDRRFNLAPGEMLAQFIRLVRESRIMIDVMLC
jgi:hypothetical protein